MKILIAIFLIVLIASTTSILTEGFETKAEKIAGVLLLIGEIITLLYVIYK